MTIEAMAAEPPLPQQTNVTAQPAATALLASVIVPVYNGATVIERCLDALAAQTLVAQSWELIVVDDGSTDTTAERVRQWCTQHPACCVRFISQPNAGPAAARNHGARIASGPVLLFTDADCAPQPDWVAQMLAVFADPDVVGAKGVYLSTQSHLVPRFVQVEYEDRYDRMAGLSQIDFIDTYSAAYRRDVFLENGGFDPIFTTASVEDQEFSFRLAQKGYRMVFAPNARVVHIHDESLGDYVRRKYFIGFWKSLLTRWHPERMVHDSHTPQTLKIQIVLTALMIGLLPVALAGIWLPILAMAWWPLLALAATTVLTAAPFSLKLWSRSPALGLAGIPMIFVRAVALGAGYLAGTIHFAGAGAAGHQPIIPGWKRFIKRGMDIAGALAGLMFVIPLVAIAAIAIKLDTPGPVFYRQQRVGENGRIFQIIKLRSMVQNAEEQLDGLINLDELPEPVFKLARDPRITRIGHILRRTSLDETPQFINVLRGEMSLVGPRPEEARVVARYDDYHRKRLAIKPGMTGPMQIAGRGTLTLTERLLLEMDYIENYSLRRDLQILLRTLPAVIRGHGAL